MIEAELENGDVLEFPDGTSPEIVQMAVKRHLGVEQQKVASTPEAVAEPQVAPSEVSAEGLLMPALPALDALGSITTNAVGEVAGGLAGLLTPGVNENPDTAIKVLNAVQAAIGTEPVTQDGKALLSKLGEAMQSTGFPAGMDAASKAIGDFGFEISGGNPKAGAIGAAVPTAILELIGLKGMSTIRGAKKVSGIPDEIAQKLESEGKSIDSLSDDDIKKVNADVIDFVAERKARIEQFRELGIEPTKAQVTRDATDFQTQEELAKTTSRTRSQLEQQDQAIDQTLREASLGTGGAVRSESSIVSAITDRANDLDSHINSLYERARTIAPGAKNVRFEKFGEALKKHRGDDTKTGGTITSLVTRLSDAGLINKQTYKPTGKISVEQSEVVRQFLNQQFDPKNGFNNTVIRDLKNALDDDVFTIAGEDYFREARRAKASFEQGLDKARISKFDSRRSNLVRDVLENRIDPEQLTQKVVFSKSYRGSDLLQLKRYLNQDVPGKAAWNDLRAETLELIREKSFIGPEDSSGVKSLSAHQLDNQLRRIGKKRLEVLFTPDERAFLNNMQFVAKLRTPARRTANGRGPSAQAVNPIEKMLQRLGRRDSVFAEIFGGVQVNRADRAAVTIPNDPELQVSLKAGQAAAAVGGASALSGSERRRELRRRKAESTR